MRERERERHTHTHRETQRETECVCLCVQMHACISMTLVMGTLAAKLQRVLADSVPWQFNPALYVEGKIKVYLLGWS